MDKDKQEVTPFKLTSNNPRHLDNQAKFTRKSGKLKHVESILCNIEISEGASHTVWHYIYIAISKCSSSHLII